MIFHRSFPRPQVQPPQLFARKMRANCWSGKYQEYGRGTYLSGKAASLMRCVSPIHHQNGPSKKCRVVAGEVGEKRSHFIRSGDPTNRVIAAKHIPKPFLIARSF